MNNEEIIGLAKDIGRKIQACNLYLQLEKAKKEMQEDKELQDLICEFNLKKMQINNEICKEEKDEEKLKILNDGLRDDYSKILENNIMANYSDLNNNMNALLKKIYDIVVLSAQGEDPDTAQASSECTHNCSSCGGCH